MYPRHVHGVDDMRRGIIAGSATFSFALVGGRSHVAKARERMRQLQKIIRQENLTATDRSTATRILDDLEDALNATRVHP